MEDMSQAAMKRYERITKNKNGGKKSKKKKKKKRQRISRQTLQKNKEKEENDAKAEEDLQTIQEVTAEQEAKSPLIDKSDATDEGGGQLPVTHEAAFEISRSDLAPNFLLDRPVGEHRARGFLVEHGRLAVAGEDLGGNGLLDFGAEVVRAVQALGKVVLVV